MRGWLGCLGVLVLACTGEPGGKTPADSDAEPVSKDPRWPFPSAHHVVDGQVALPSDLIASPSPLPTDRLTWRTGFSPLQTIVVRPGVALDPASLPGLYDAPARGSIQLWDLDEGTFVPCFAELDQYPELEDAERTLMIRPLVPMPLGHRIAVALTDQVKTADGSPMPEVDWFGGVLRGDGDADLAPWQDHYQGLVDQLETLGARDLVLAFDFPVAADVTSPLEGVLEDLTTPESYTFDTIYSADAADGRSGSPPPLPALTGKRLEGTFTTADWLGSDGMTTLDADGVPRIEGEVEAQLYVHVSASALERGPGEAPVWIFGHGIFANPGFYMDEPADESALLELADRAGAIVVGTIWRGLTTSDFGVPVTVAQDFGKFNMLTDHLTQGVANTDALVRLVTDGDLLDDPELLGLPDRDTIRYYGISLGGIEGAVLMANEPRIPHGVLHVGGSTWSTMLERSTHWATFEGFMLNVVTDASERQLMYSLSQLFWDPIDPANYADRLRDRSVLWQIALGDDQVPNFTTYTLARAAGARVLSPAVEVPFGFEAGEGPLLGPAISQFDPDEGNSELSNRPAVDTTSHEVPRTWEGAKQQVLDFLDAETPGAALHACGPSPCALGNTGD